MASTLETDAFGVETSRSDPSVGPPSRSGFAGGWGYEGEGGGLSLVGNRWYDADAGRFLTRDPARDGSNWWAYVANDPVNAVDPEGLEWWGYPNDGDARSIADPFRFKVIAFGEPGPSQKARGLILRTNERDPDGFDVDQVIVVNKQSGDTKVYHISGGNSGMVGAQVIVDFDGRVRAVGPTKVTLIRHGDGSQTSRELGEILPWVRKAKSGQGTTKPRKLGSTADNIAGFIRNAFRYIRKKSNVRPKVRY